MDLNPDLSKWIGENAFGLGCEISTILKRHGIIDSMELEVCLVSIFSGIRDWYKYKSDQLSGK